MGKPCYNTETALRQLPAKDSLDDSLIPFHWMSWPRDKYGCADPGNTVIGKSFF